MTVEELELAWRAVRSGQFRADPHAPDPHRPDGNRVDPQGVTVEEPTVDGSAGLIGEPVVVVGAHGWSGTSTTALLIAEAAARLGRPVRVLDLAAPARSGFAGASVTEHGVDATGRWRQGNRGAVAVHRLAGPVRHLRGVPAPLAVPGQTVSVIDTGWPVTDVLQLLGESRAGGHWLDALVRSAPLVLTARATTPGLRHAEASVQALAAVRGPGTRIVLALLGQARLPRRLTTWAGEAVAAADRQQLVVPVRECSGLSRAGLTPAALPRVLQPAGERLLQLTYPQAHHASPVPRPRRRLFPHRSMARKDEQ